MPRSKRKSDTQKRLESKLKMRELRAAECSGEEIRRKDRETRARKRKAESEEEHAARLENDRSSKRRRREQETKEQIEVRAQKEKHAQSERRRSETTEQTKQRLEKEKHARSERRKSETGEQTKQRLEKKKNAESLRRSLETEEQTKQRLEKKKNAESLRRSLETEKQTKQRLEKKKNAKSLRRSLETEEQTKQRLEKKKNAESLRRSLETEKQTKQRLEKKKNAESLRRSLETEEQTKERLEKKKSVESKKRISETVNQRNDRREKSRITMKNVRQVRCTTISTNDELVEKFLRNVKDSANYVCCSCHRLMYRITVVQLHDDSYPKAKPAMLKNVLSYRMVSAREKEWICRTCHLTLKRGKMPTQAKANNLALTDQPPELKALNSLELRLICQRIPFMKMVGLPRGKQHGIHGPAVNVPAKLDTICTLFPRLPSETHLIPMKFKRKLEHSSHYM